MIKIGITGQNGFVGKHLVNTLKVKRPDVMLVPFDRTFFENGDLLDEFVLSCDVVIHLAAKNRDESETVIYETNRSLAQRLSASLYRTNAKPYLIFSSSTQEVANNPYGNSKREARELFEAWATSTGSIYAGLIIPNVFGPFCRPFYNSFVATFSHQLINGDEPNIIVDKDVDLIYVDELVDRIISLLDKRVNENAIIVSHTTTMKVSDVLGLLKEYRSTYLEKGQIPTMSTVFERNLFNTFRSYIDHSSKFPVSYIQHKDERGIFSELIRVNCGGQISFSTTLPGVVRGNHFHTRKVERFSVIKGDAIIKLRKFGEDEVLTFRLSGSAPAYVDMPVWYIHNIQNVGNDELITVFWINELYDPKDHDTYFEIV